MSHGKWIPKECTDKRCLTGTMCRQAAWGQVCKALKDPYFESGVCPFYKTKQQYAEEYKASNTFKIDPYINPNRGQMGKDTGRHKAQRVCADIGAGIERGSGE